MASPILQGSSVQPLIFFIYASSDHVSGLTGASPTVKLGKNGGTGAAPSGAVTEIDSTNLPGFYQVAANATDSNTLGPLILSATAVGGDQATMLYDIVAFDPQTVAVGALQPTTAGRKLDVSTGGEAGVDWANVGSPTTTLNLSGTTISTSQVVASVTGAVGSVTGAVGSVTGNVGGNVNGSVAGSVGSVVGSVGGNVTGSVGSLATQAKTDVENATWNTVLASHLTAGSTGKALSDASAGSDPDAIASAVLTKDYTSIPDGDISAKCLLQSSRSPLNGFSIVAGSPPVLHVKKEDETTTAYTLNLTTDPTAEPITGAGA